MKLSIDADSFNTGVNACTKILNSYKDISRPVLTYICIRVLSSSSSSIKPHVEMCAVNGYSGIRVLIANAVVLSRQPDDDYHEILIDPNVLEKAQAGTTVCIDDSGDNVTIEYTHKYSRKTASHEKVAGPYVDIDRIFFKHADGDFSCFAVNPKYLKGVVDAMTDNKYLQFEVHGSTDPIIIRGSGDDLTSEIALILPIRL